jgi:hypothetical protein
MCKKSVQRISNITCGRTEGQRDILKRTATLVGKVLGILHEARTCTVNKSPPPQPPPPILIHTILTYFHRSQN